MDIFHVAVIGHNRSILETFSRIKDARSFMREQKKKPGVWYIALQGRESYRHSAIKLESHRKQNDIWEKLT